MCPATSSVLDRALRRHRIYLVLGIVEVVCFSVALLVLWWLVEPFVVGTIEGYHGRLWFTVVRNLPIPFLTLAGCAILCGVGAHFARRWWRRRYPRVTIVDEALRS